MCFCFHVVSDGNTASEVDGNCGQTFWESYTFINFLENENLVLKFSLQGHFSSF